MEEDIELSKIMFFIKKRRILWTLGLISIIFLFISVILDISHIFNVNNFCWNILINIVCGYIISLIFYIMLVYNGEYNDYAKKYVLEKRVIKYFSRIDVYIDGILQVLDEYMIVEFDTDPNFIPYYKIKNYETNIPNSCELFAKDSVDNIVKSLVKKVNENISRINHYVYYLNNEAINVITYVENTYIFENINNDEIYVEYQTMFDLSIDTFRHNLRNVFQMIRSLEENGCMLDK